MTAARVTPQTSVIIPARNCPAHLSAALRSIALSTYRDYEVIVVNDASTDRTRDEAVAAGATVIDLPDQRGPAAARNAGVRSARGEVIVFFDADVCVQPDTLERLVRTLIQRSEVVAVFGSYDRTPHASNIVSQYRNLVHHFVHQTSSTTASTFWAGCGAIRRSVFVDIGGFDEGYSRPSVEDIELGMRLRAAGHAILLDHSVQVQHLKRWDLWGMLVTDIFSRGVPWTRLLLKARAVPNDLNLKISQRVSAILALVILGLIIATALENPWVWAVALLSLVAFLMLDEWSLTRRVPHVMRISGVALAVTVVGAAVYFSPKRASLVLLLLLGLALINVQSYSFFARERHPLFALLVLPLHLLFLWYSMFAFGLGVLSSAFDFVSRKNPGSRGRRSITPPSADHRQTRTDAR
jgi:glycosyltransferase involved in cell wall biosynthesis